MEPSFSIARQETLPGLKLINDLAFFLGIFVHLTSAFLISLVKNPSVSIFGITKGLPTVVV